MKAKLKDITVGETVRFSNRLLMRIKPVTERCVEGAGRHRKVALRTRNFVCLSGFQSGQLWTFSGDDVEFETVPYGWRFRLIYFLLKY